MDFLELVKNRESVRDYDPERPVDEVILTRILEAGRYAPSAVNKQPWKFVLVSGQDMLSGVKSCYNRPWLQNAPHILIVMGKVKEAWVRKDGYCSIETDLGIAMDHLILAATAEGIGTCWIQAFDAKQLNEVLHLKEDEVVFAITPLGYPKPGYKKSIKQRKELGDIVSFL